jgi:DNA-entry nuclease
MKRLQRFKLKVIMMAACIAVMAGGCSVNSGMLPVKMDPTIAVTVSADTETTASPETANTTAFSYDAVPAYSGQPYAVMNNNIPYFTELSDVSYQEFSDLDALGRCGLAKASVGQDIMPTEKRGDIGMIKPSGWHNKKYDAIKDSDNAAGYLYNRCHLIGYQLTGQNANEKNLITGTRYLNVTGMLPFENQIADYVHETGNHVEYHVTPIFVGNELLARGVLMEAESVEDNGSGIKFNVFCYNVQPGITLDYATGENHLSDDTTAQTKEAVEDTGYPELLKVTGELSEYKYIVNINSKKIHTPDCKNAKEMSAKNRRGYNGNIQDLLSAGYEKAKDCDPE